MKIKDHYKKMDHEFARVTTPLEKYGYKMDGENGIKQRCALDKLKAADYIDDETTKIAFVEFSDIARQFHNLLGENEILEKLVVSKKTEEAKVCRTLCKNNLDSVIDEIKQKFKDSLHILGEVKVRYVDIPLSFTNKPFALLVIAPHSNDDQPCRKDEIARLLDNLNNRLTLSLPENLFSGFRMLTIERYFPVQ
ncbi:hypothetical protein [Undibacterium flavidum]|uniref:Uncharacterized protein n=1 Tax=Undibacterium flavidum TaxID=2762297 RepID=A0ABR6YDC3_9BURK|nr:hypothetical protein [Undibacterium flavidum]MBC3874550.1 hypothetical protein [Undibacterium flavidum]